jgi:hypothetical protein
MAEYRYRIVKGYGGDENRQWQHGKPYTEMRNTHYQRAYSMNELKTLYLACQSMLAKEGQMTFLKDNKAV